MNESPVSVEFNADPNTTDNATALKNNYEETDLLSMPFLREGHQHHSTNNAPALELKDVGELTTALLRFQQFGSSNQHEESLIYACTSLITLHTKRKRVKIDNDDSPSNKRRKDDSLIRPAAVAALAPAEASSDIQGQSKEDSVYLHSRNSNASGFLYAIGKNGSSICENIWKETNEGIGAAETMRSNFNSFTTACELKVIVKEDDEDDDEEDGVNNEDYDSEERSMIFDSEKFVSARLIQAKDREDKCDSIDFDDKEKDNADEDDYEEDGVNNEDSDSEERSMIFYGEKFVSARLIQAKDGDDECDAIDFDDEDVLDNEDVLEFPWLDEPTTAAAGTKGSNPPPPKIHSFLNVSFNPI